MSLVVVFAPCDRIVVGRLGVVGDEVARLQAELLEIERVRRGDFRQRLGAAEQVDRLLVAAVHRVEHLQLLDAEVVVGAHFGEHFLDRAGLRVAARLVEADRRGPGR